MNTSTGTTRTALILAGLFGLAGVGLGALGAHGLRATLLARGTAAAWETGARYHMFHVIALFAAAAWLRGTAGGIQTCGKWAIVAWAGGIVLFSGSLYWLALGGPRWLGPVTPFGGILLMVGWALVLASAFVDEGSASRRGRAPSP